jgi:membrane associated rhomboid family serine protease
MIGVIGWGIVACGPVAGLAIADAPLAVATCVGYALFGLAGAFVRLRRRWRSRGQGMRLPPPLTGWRLGFAGGLALGCAAWALIMGGLGSLAGAAAFGGPAVLFAMWCRLSGREDDVPEREERDAWKPEELAVVNDPDASTDSLERLLDELPVIKYEGKFR